MNGLLLYHVHEHPHYLARVFQEITIRTNMHSARFYLVVSLAVPLWLAIVSAVSSQRWHARRLQPSIPPTTLRSSGYSRCSRLNRSWDRLSNGHEACPRRIFRCC